MTVSPFIEPVELKVLRELNSITWGILGGMGPIASSDLVCKIYQRVSDGRPEQLMPNCSGLRLSGFGREIIPVSGSDYLRLKMNLGSQ